MRKATSFVTEDGKRTLRLLDEDKAKHALSTYHKQAIRLNRELQKLVLFGEHKTDRSVVHNPAMQLLVEARDAYEQARADDDGRLADAMMGRMVGLVGLVTKLRADAASQLAAAVDREADRKLKAAIASRGQVEMTAAELFRLAQEGENEPPEGG
jgi:hypothetical protein